MGGGYRFDIADFAPAGVREEDGWHQMDIRFTVTKDTAGAEQVVFFRTVFPPGTSAHKKHIHTKADEIMYVVRGRAAQGVDDEEFDVPVGCGVYIPMGAVHWTRNMSDTEPMELVGVYTRVGSLEESGYQYIGEVQEKDRQVK
jgi:mannose-6-phosphate isomerase-like protein (cupin superfamily)